MRLILEVAPACNLSHLADWPRWMEQHLPVCLHNQLPRRWLPEVFPLGWVLLTDLLL